MPPCPFMDVKQGKSENSYAGLSRKKGKQIEGEKKAQPPFNAAISDELFYRGFNADVSERAAICTSIDLTIITTCF